MTSRSLVDPIITPTFITINYYNTITHLVGFCRPGFDDKGRLGYVSGELPEEGEFFILLM
jgi:hypothetical protein